MGHRYWTCEYREGVEERRERVPFWEEDERREPRAKECRKLLKAQKTRKQVSP